MKNLNLEIKQKSKSLDFTKTKRNSTESVKRILSLKPISALFNYDFNFKLSQEEIDGIKKDMYNMK